ncbi:UNVERIFIED_CONTAM: hypothetical protein Slati_4476100 [Sesamum latifolium]|uniref:Uncharacterized protein n=1 Tax=Sesamum latifolium TaxID=2727402 RepID=A0AAW2SRP6_9LAMI
MGPRRGAGSQSSVARMPGQEPESPRRAASPSERAVEPEDENSWLRRRAFGGNGVADMWREMEQMSIQIGLLQHAVSNGPAVAYDAGARYFLAANVEDEARKVSTATMYLTSDAKLWWRTKYAEIQANQAGIAEVGAFRLRARYVKSFSALMLDIRDMSEKDKLFTFMEGLKPWARLELQRQRVTDLGLAMAAAERLTDFASETRKDRQTTSRQFSQEQAPGEQASPAKPVEPQASASGGNDSEEDEDNLGAISQWCNTLSHQVAAKKTVPPRAGKIAPALTGSHPEEEAQPRNPRKKGLMFVDVKIHGKSIRAMIDTGATHNYLASVEVERLGLVLEKGVGRVKAINSAAQPIAGVAKSVLIKVGPFEGKTDLSVVVIDDFKLIIGLEFLRDTHTAVLPHVDSLMMMGTKPCVIPTLAGRTGEKNLSAMQFEKGCKRSEPSYLCTLRFDEIEEASGPFLAS